MSTPADQRRLLAVLPALLLAMAVVLIAPWHLCDPDELGHLAIGRTIAQTGGVPATDPLTFSDPGARWSNPEWFGDLVLYLIHAGAGETGLQLFKLGLICLGWLLLLRLARRHGAEAWLTVAFLLLALLSTTHHFTLRNRIHLYWLIPLYALLLERARADRQWRWLLALLPLGALWANLHGSFILGWVVIGAALAQALVSRRDKKEVGALALLLAVHPLLAMISPHGLHNYGQVADHLLGAEIYRSMIVEWQPPGQSATLIEQLPLHLIGVVGLLSFLPRKNRRQVGSFLLLVVGLALAYSSRRFIPLLVVLAAPGVTANLTRFMATTAVPFRRYVTAAAVVLAAALLSPVIWTARTTDSNPHLLRRPGAPVAAARFLARAAPEGSRLFNPYNAGPWLLWEAPRVRLYIDPRNNLGARALERFSNDVRLQPARFDEEVRRLEINLAMLDLSNVLTWPLNLHLDRSHAWRPVYLDGRYAVYARKGERNRELLGEHAFHLVRARLGFEHLLQRRPSEPDHTGEGREARLLAVDLRQLERQGPALVTVLEAYRLLTGGQDRPPPAIFPVGAKEASRTRRASELLDRALPRLPPSAVRMTYLATALARLGRRRACDAVLAQARAHHPDHPMVLGLELELARLDGDQNLRSLLLRRRAQAPPDHVVWQILSGERFRLPGR